MTKNLKKIATIVAAFAMVMAMSIPSFAESPQSGSTFTFSKTLYVRNVCLTSVDGPGLTFSYAIAPVAPTAANGGTTITDGTHTSAVRTGISGGLTLSGSTISWPIGTAVDANDGEENELGAPNTKSLSLVAHVNEFASAGIYRYGVTENKTEDISDIGRTETPYTIYADVYITNGNAGLEVSGIVMHEANGEKCDAFSYENFDTINLYVRNNVEGLMGDKWNEFPFDITVSDNGRYYYDGKGYGYTPPDDPSINRTGSGTTELADGQGFWILGLSRDLSTISVTETNNTEDTYLVAGGTESQESVAPNGTYTLPTTSASSYEVTMSDTGIEFYNTLDAVSPTGVVMRFGAPLLVLAAAAALVLMNRKSRKANSVE